MMVSLCYHDGIGSTQPASGLRLLEGGIVGFVLLEGLLNPANRRLGERDAIVRGSRERLVAAIQCDFEDVLQLGQEVLAGSFEFLEGFREFRAAQLFVL